MHVLCPCVRLVYWQLFKCSKLFHNHSRHLCCWFFFLSRVNIEPFRSGLEHWPCVVHNLFICSKQRRFPFIMGAMGAVRFLLDLKLICCPYLYTLHLDFI